jgi:hypothetical protein
MGDRRIVINNGGIADVIETTEEERGLLEELKIIDDKLTGLREDLRYGNRLPSFLFSKFKRSKMIG